MTRISPVPREARPYQGQPAGLITRSIAAALDLVVALITSLGSYLIIAGVGFLIRPWSFHFPRIPFLIGLTGTLAVLVLYLALAWSLTGRSYGDHVMGLRVVNRKQFRLRPLVALARSALSVTFPIGLLWCVVNRDSRSVQDIVCRTSVIYDWRPASAAARARAT